MLFQYKCSRLVLEELISCRSIQELAQTLYSIVALEVIIPTPQVPAERGQIRQSVVSDAVTDAADVKQANLGRLNMTYVSTKSELASSMRLKKFVTTEAALGPRLRAFFSGRPASDATVCVSLPRAG